MLNTVIIYSYRIALSSTAWVMSDIHNQSDVQNPVTVRTAQRSEEAWFSGPQSGPGWFIRALSPTGHLHRGAYPFCQDNVLLQLLSCQDSNRDGRAPGIPVHSAG